MEGKKEEESEAKLYRWVFGISGTVHLTSIDWKKLEHKRSVLASLVQGVYVLERDRHSRRIGHNALAPPWWDFFQFQCIKTLVDQVDSSIFGAIFEYKTNNAHNCYHQQGDPPRFVIALRGTIMEPATRKRDLSLDIKVPLNKLSMDTRYHIAFEEIQDILTLTFPEKVILVGHSLGAAIALEAGKDMARRGCHVQTYLFNPPYTSVPIEMIDNPDLKGKVRVTKSILTVNVYKVVRKNDYRRSRKSLTTQNNDDSFYSLCSWVPNLFVNPKDPICCEYIGHFEHRGRLKEMGKEEVDIIATKNSLLSMLAGALGRGSEPPHLIPSAMLTKNMIVQYQSVKESHCIDQWWKPHPHWHSKLYVWGQSA